MGFDDLSLSEKQVELKKISLKEFDALYAVERAQFDSILGHINDTVIKPNFNFIIHNGWAYDLTRPNWLQRIKSECIMRRSTDPYTEPYVNNGDGFCIPMTKVLAVQLLLTQVFQFDPLELARISAAIAYHLQILDPRFHMKATETFFSDNIYQLIDMACKASHILRIVLSVQILKYSKKPYSNNIIHFLTATFMHLNDDNTAKIEKAFFITQLIYQHHFKQHELSLKEIYENSSLFALIKKIIGEEKLPSSKEDLIHGMFFAVTNESHEKIKISLSQNGAYACSINKPLRNINEIIALILFGHDVNAESEAGKTPLSFAAEKGDIETVRFLIAAGADVNTGYPLITAVIGGHIDIIRLLIYAGADVNARHAWSNTTVLCVAARYGHTKVVQMLIDAGASIYYGNPLQSAVKNGQKHIIHMLCRAGVDIDHVIEDFYSDSTLLIDAVRDGSIDHVHNLLEAGANVNLKTNRKQTTAIYCATTIEMIRILFEAGANVNVTASNGQTPLGNARSFGNNEIIHFLKLCTEVNKIILDRKTPKACVLAVLKACIQTNTPAFSRTYTEPEAVPKAKALVTAINKSGLTGISEAKESIQVLRPLLLDAVSKWDTEKNSNLNEYERNLTSVCKHLIRHLDLQLKKLELTAQMGDFKASSSSTNGRKFKSN